jgi:hypothetical protein
MVWEAARKGVHGHACGRGEQGGKDVELGRVKVLAALEEG